MSTEKDIKKSLDYIRKKGDIYDAVSQKRNVTPDKTLYKVLKYNVLLFSRVLYLLVAGIPKIKNKFTPVKRIKHEQDKIREYIGLPIDILSSKNNNPNLGIIYGNFEENATYRNSAPEKEVLVQDLQKLLDFCTKFEIDKIYFQKNYLYKYLNDDFINEFPLTSYATLMKYDFYKIDYYLLSLDKNQLSEIIEALKNSNYDHSFISLLQEKIQDNVIVEAINEFKCHKNTKKLLEIVKSRLILNINSEGTSKDRTRGKIYEQVEIFNKYVRSIVCDDAGNIINQNDLTLYDYLEANNYESLEKSINTLDENREIKLIALLYLYLLGERPLQENEKNKKNASFYDFIYENYQKRRPFKKIPWVKTKTQKIKSEGYQIVIAFMSVISSIFLYLTATLITSTFLDEEKEFTQKCEDILENIINAYEENFEFDVKIAKHLIEKFFPNTSKKDIASLSQELMHASIGDDKCVAEIEWFTKEKMPLYFLDKYAYSIYYGTEEISYYFNNETMDMAFIKDLRPMFQIKTSIDESLMRLIDRDSHLLPLDFYPVGDNYALTQVYIIDELDPTKIFQLDDDWKKPGWKFSEEDKKILHSMENPMIHYIYGISDDFYHRYAKMNIAKDNLTHEEIKDAIIKGLGLNENATTEEIIDKISEKKYTKTPLTYSVKELSELEYYEKIASLDKVNIDLMMNLILGADENLIYSIGYKNADNDDELTLDEAYLWAMTREGEVVDILDIFKDNQKTEKQKKEEDKISISTNSISFNEDLGKSSILSYDERKEQEKNIAWELDESVDDENVENTIEEIFSWGIKNHIPYYLCGILAMLIIYRLFGKKIKLKLKLKNVNKKVSAEEISETYANLMEFLYGGTNIPIRRNKADMIDTIYKEFKAIKLEKIKELLKILRAEITKSSNSKDLKNIYELLEDIPFIIEHKDTLKETPEKELVLGGRNGK